MRHLLLIAIAAFCAPLFAADVPLLDAPIGYEGGARDEIYDVAAARRC